MGQGAEEKIQDSPAVEVQERGEIYFFYRPKVAVDELHSKEELQRVYLVLRPEFAESAEHEKQGFQSGIEGIISVDDIEKEGLMSIDEIDGPKKTALNGENGADNEVNIKQTEVPAEDGTVDIPKDNTNGEHEEAGDLLKSGTEDESGGGQGTKKVRVEKKPMFRYIVLERKSLPAVSEPTHPYSGVVELVTPNPEDLKKALAAVEHQRETLGQKVDLAAKPGGEGIYYILRRQVGSKIQTQLIYQLELSGPHKKHEPEDALNIGRQGSFNIQIKNPEQSAPASEVLGNKRKAFFPAYLQGQLGSQRFVAADPPDLLNYEGCEFILISASDDIEAELVSELKSEEEQSKEWPDVKEILGEQGAKELRVVRPLIEGEWV